MDLLRRGGFHVWNLAMSKKVFSRSLPPSAQKASPLQSVSISTFELQHAYGAKSERLLALPLPSDVDAVQRGTRGQTPRGHSPSSKGARPIIASNVHPRLRGLRAQRSCTALVMSNERS